MSNVEKFFEIYDSDPELRARVKSAEAAYPGSLEIREAVAEYALLPAARDLGLEFTIDELRKYETRKKMAAFTEDPEKWLEEEPDSGSSYWLLERGWSDDETRFTK
ncbi:MAG: hypothetical protein ACOX68_00325 [Candidatus Limivicinus sp.]|jgi:hypothetical protein